MSAAARTEGDDEGGSAALPDTEMNCIADDVMGMTVAGKSSDMETTKELLSASMALSLGVSIGKSALAV